MPLGGIICLVPPFVVSLFFLFLIFFGSLSPWNSLESIMKPAE